MYSHVLFVGIFDSACGHYQVCPYYATRTLKDEAEIVFCPYNYLIDPKIRNQVKLNVLFLDKIFP